MDGDTEHGEAQAARVTDLRAELSDFLRTRRARLQPEEVGLPNFGRRRRVPGLRREELAQIAGVSVAYYTRLEQGNGNNVSEEVLTAISRALRLSSAEQAHLVRLARPRPRTARPPVQRQALRGSLQDLIDGMESVPAYVTGRRSDILGWNALASALFGDWSQMAPEDRNWARFTFLRPEYRELFVDWQSKAEDMVSALRMEASRFPEDTRLAALVGELSVKSDEFRVLWARHAVKEKSYGSKRLRHPLVGEISLTLESFRAAADDHLQLVTYHAAPDSPAEESLRLLASWHVNSPHSEPVDS